MDPGRINQAPPTTSFITKSFPASKAAKDNPRAMRPEVALSSAPMVNHESYINSGTNGNNAELISEDNPPPAAF